MGPQTFIWVHVIKIGAGFLCAKRYGAAKRPHGGLKLGSQKGVILAAQNEPKSGVSSMVYLHAGLEIGSAVHMLFTGSLTKTHMYLALRDLHGPRRGDDSNWVHNCQNGKIGHLGRPSRVGNLGDIDAPSLDSQPWISPMVPCPGLWLAVRMVPCCSSRRRTRGWGRKQHAVQRERSCIAPKVESLRMSRRSRYETQWCSTLGHLLQ